MDKILLITNIPNHYRIPLFNALDRIFDEKGIDFKVVFGADRYEFRKNIVDLSNCKFKYQVLSPQTKKNRKLNYGGLYRLLKREKPSFILVSGFSMATLKIMFFSMLFRVPYGIWSGSIQIGKRNKSILKNIVRSFMIRFASRSIAYGSMAKEYMLALGAKSEKVSAIGNTIDISQLSTEVNALRIANKKVKRTKSHLLYLGYLTPLKNLKPLIQLMFELSKERQDFVFDIVGDGESRAELEAQVERLQLQNFIVFHGFKQRAEVAKYYAAADIFLFQTEADIWGLVLNEAMCAALPTIVSCNAGAAVDLIIEGETGFVVDFHNTKEVLSKLNWLLDHPAKAKQIGERAASFIQSEYTIKAVASRFKDAILS